MIILEPFTERKHQEFICQQIRNRQKYDEVWTVFGPVRTRRPKVLCPGIVREGNRAVPALPMYKNADKEPNTSEPPTS